MRPREREVARIVIHADDTSTRPHDEVVRQLTLARPDVENVLARPHALDEEVVVARQAVLGMHAAVVRDRRQVDLAIHVVVRDQELPHGAAPVGVGA